MNGRTEYEYTLNAKLAFFILFLVLAWRASSLTTDEVRQLKHCA